MHVFCLCLYFFNATPGMSFWGHSEKLEIFTVHVGTGGDVEVPGSTGWHAQLSDRDTSLYGSNFCKSVLDSAKRPRNDWLHFFAFAKLLMDEVD